MTEYQIELTYEAQIEFSELCKINHQQWSILYCLLDLKQSYGNEINNYICNRSKGIDRILDGTLYTSLQKLNDKGYIERTEFISTDTDIEVRNYHSRKYYKLTSKGYNLVQTHSLQLGLNGGSKS